MIEITYKTGRIRKFDIIDDISNNMNQYLSIQIIDYTEYDLECLAKKFNLNLSFFKQNEDIEISSHYQESGNQLSFNFSIPLSIENISFDEEIVYFVLKNQVFFIFLTSRIEKKFFEITKFSYRYPHLKIKTYEDLLLFIISISSDYYADLVEIISKHIKQLYRTTLYSKRFIESDLDTITKLNFANILVKESSTEFQRILSLLARNISMSHHVLGVISKERKDLLVIAEHLQYNFDRLDDLRENISNKINVEQNKVFKILTIITVCIAIPTFIAGVYGMNFSNMPELNWKWGYGYSLSIMIFGVSIALIYFKRKEWF
ncbi:MAG: CorA family divalent cation transporter [Chitinophagaceae bacterium]